MAQAHEVVLLRHGETEWSATGRHTGTTDVPLTDRGREQARALAPRLTRWTFALTLTSPLQRAVETARLAGLDATEDPDLREWDYGEHEGRTTVEIRETEPGWTVWDGSIPDGESIAQVAARADRVIERVLAIDGPVALVAHGHLLRVLAARWIELAPIEGRRLALDPATLGILGWEREARSIHLWNAG